MNQRRRSGGITLGAGVLIVAVGVVLLTGGTAVADTTDSENAVVSTSTVNVADPHDRGFLVNIQTDGSAEIAVTYTFDLTDEDRQQAFEELRESDEDRAAVRERFADRMETIAADASADVDREMSVSDATIDFETVDETGVVTLAVTWNGLAAVDDDSLVVTEPFASGFEPDRPFHLVAPDDYEWTVVDPTPGVEAEKRLSWDEGSELSDFEAVASPVEAGVDGEDEGADDTTVDDEETDSSDDADSDTTNDADADTADDDGPGFGPIAAVLGAVTAVLLARRL